MMIFPALLFVSELLPVCAQMAKLLSAPDRALVVIPWKSIWPDFSREKYH
jgi:hypothetical protein